METNQELKERHLYSIKGIFPKYIIKKLECANCAKKIENKIANTEGYSNVVLNFATQKLSFQTDKNNVKEEASKSMLAKIATPFAYLFAPITLSVENWQLSAAAITGFIAKENVVGTLTVCYGAVDKINADISDTYKDMLEPINTVTAINEAIEQLSKEEYGTEKFDKLYKKILEEIKLFKASEMVSKLNIDVVFDENYKFNLFKSDVVVKGKDISILASGTMVHEAKLASKMLEEEGISAEVISINMIKPLDKETILKSVKKTNHVVVCENHNIYGGVYSAIAEMLCQEYPVKCGVIGVNDVFGQVGKYDELLKTYCMTKEDIVRKVKEQLK